jgi:hypothetical protein
MCTGELDRSRESAGAMYVLNLNLEAIMKVSANMFLDKTHYL